MMDIRVVMINHRDSVENKDNHLVFLLATVVQ